MWRRVIIVLVTVLATTACAVNPVTGQRELGLITTADEIQIGEQYYAPSLQMQGGEYRLDPALTAYIEEVGRRLAEVSDRELPYQFAVINSSVPNAWALPGGKIAINRGLLLEMQSEAELAAVLGHEIVHAAARHGARAQQRAMLLQGVILAGAIASGDSGFGHLAVGGLSVAAQLVSQRYSRGAELEADRYGMIYMSRAGYDTQGAVELQETFVRLSGDRRQDWLSGLFASHPPTQERVRANRATAAELPSGGESGRTAYLEATATLREQQPAYELIDAGRKALVERDYDTARARADEAIALLPQEAHGYALRGDVARMQQRPGDALADYRQAVERDPGFFYFPLQSGLARLALEQWQAAGEDLRQSVALLPTVPAYYGLGVVAEREGDLPGAKDYYRRAASPNSEAGRAAQRALLRLDLADNPGDYLRLRHGTDAQGRLVAEVHNPQPLAVTGLVVELRYRDAAGRLREERRALRSAVAAGATVQETIASAAEVSGARELEVRLVAARLVDEAEPAPAAR